MTSLERVVFARISLIRMTLLRSRTILSSSAIRASSSSLSTPRNSRASTPTRPTSSSWRRRARNNRQGREFNHQAAPGISELAVDDSTVVDAVLAGDEAVPLHALDDAAGSRKSNAEPFGDATHRRGAVLAEEEEEPHLAEGQLLLGPVGDLSTVNFPLAADGVQQLLDLELVLRYFAHRRIVS